MKKIIHIVNKSVKWKNMDKKSKKKKLSYYKIFSTMLIQPLLNTII